MNNFRRRCLIEGEQLDNWYVSFYGYTNIRGFVQSGDTFIAGLFGSGNLSLSVLLYKNRSTPPSSSDVLYKDFTISDIDLSLASPDTTISVNLYSGTITIETKKVTTNIENSTPLIIVFKVTNNLNPDDYIYIRIRKKKEYVEE